MTIFKLLFANGQEKHFQAEDYLKATAYAERKYKVRVLASVECPRVPLNTDIEVVS